MQPPGRRGRLPSLGLSSPMSVQMVMMMMRGDGDDDDDERGDVGDDDDYVRCDGGDDKELVARMRLSPRVSTCLVYVRPSLLLARRGCGSDDHHDEEDRHQNASRC